MDKKNKFMLYLLMTQLFIIPVQIYISLDFIKKYLAYFNYRGLMKNVYKIINDNNLDKKYIYDFEEVFGHYFNNSNVPSFVERFTNLLLHIIQYTVISLSIIGYLINIISFFAKKTVNITSIGIFSCTLLVLILEIVDSFGQKTKLNLTKEEFVPFSKLDIERYLKEVSIRVKYLKIYTILLFFINIIHIIITIILCLIIKHGKNNILIENEQNNTLDMNIELGNIKKEDSGTSEKDSLIINFRNENSNIFN